MYKNKLIVISLLSFALLSNSAFAFIVFDPSNYAQNIITAKNSITSLVNQAQQIKNELQSIQYQMKNSNTISSYQWNNIMQLVQQLDSTTRQGQALSYSMSNLDQTFQQRYPNYQNSPGQGSYSQTYQTWNSTTLDTLRQSLNALGMGAKDFDNEQQLMQQLKNQGQTAQGRMQVLQVSTEIAAENVNQLQELKRITMAQANAQDAYLAYHVSKDSYEEQSIQEIDDNVQTEFPSYQDNSQLGLIPNF